MARIHSRSTVFLVLTLFIILVAPAAIRAQSTSARLSGTVWDPSDIPTPGVILTAVEEATGWQSETVSDENGRYVFTSLRPGSYTVFTRAKGYQQITRRSIYLPVNGNISESFTLDIATADETVEVEETIALDNSDLYSDISPRDLEILPMYSRNPLNLAAHVAGFQTNGGAEGVSTSNGARKGMNSLRIDGIEVSDPMDPSLELSVVEVTPDSIQTFRVITSGAKAEFGGAGGAYLGAVSQIGSKVWHGNAYEYHANKSLNANEYFRRTAGLDRPDFRRNIFGGSLSGPLGSNRTLLFGFYEGNRADSEVRRNRLVLTDDADDDENEGLNDEAKAGVFRWYTPGTTDLQSFQVVESPEAINPEVAEVLALLPSPNNDLIGDGLNTMGYIFDNPVYSNADQLAIRIDHTLNSKHNIFLRLNWNRNRATDIWNNADAPFPGTPEGTVETSSWAVVAGSHWVLNSRMINELRVGYLRPKTTFKRPARSSQSMLLFSSWTNPLNPDSPGSFRTPYLELTDGFTHQYNRHIFKYGATFRRNLQSTTDYTGVYPDITFGTDMGNAPSAGPTGNTVISDADRTKFERFYNDILGRIESIRQTYHYNLSSFQSSGSPSERNFTSFEFSGFIQDDWRIRPNITLNLGVRYDFFGAPKEQDGLQLVLDPSSNIDASANYSDFTLISSDRWRDSKLSNFAPRAGFAWDISGYGTFVLRGSYGIFYDRFSGSITRFIDQNTYGLSQTETTYPNLGGGDVRLGDATIPYPATPQNPPEWTLPATRSTSIAVLDPDLKTPRIDRFNLTLERRLTDHLVVELSYINARGRNLYQNLNYNQTQSRGDFFVAFEELKAFRENGRPVSDTNTLVQIFGSAMDAWEAIGTDASGVSYVDSGQVGAAADVIDKGYFDEYAAAGVSDFYLRNFPQFDSFIVGTDTGRSWYNSLRFGVRANSASFRLRAYYTWGKSLDTLSADGGSFVSPSNSFNPLANKAPSDFDRTHMININGSFYVPIGRNRRWGSESSRIFNWILGDWEVGYLSLWESGRRFTVGSMLQTAFAGVESLANFEGIRDIGTLYFQPSGVYWFNPIEADYFSTPGTGELGNSGRNSFKGPQYFNVDLTFFKYFNVGDNNRIQIRGEVYNLFNKTQFGLPVTNINDPDFTRFTTTVGSPRKVQVALSYSF
ncbi:MAG: TonB-dependent receptor [Acidobacteriota bacterium]